MFEIFKKKEEKVNLLIAGTQKGGTTALYFYLEGHPNIHMSKPKELHYFDDEWDNWSFDKYESFIERGGKYRGEATGAYMYFPECAERIYKYNPKMKLIFILRDPCDRAYSLYKMHTDTPHSVYRQKQGRPFKLKPFYEQIEEDPYDRQYIERGYYHKQIKNMLKWFPREQMHFIRTEDLFNRTQETMNGVFDFLSLGHTKCPSHLICPINGKVVIVDRKPHKLEKRSPLVDKYIEDITKLEKLLGWDLSSWKRATS